MPFRQSMMQQMDGLHDEKSDVRDLGSHAHGEVSTMFFNVECPLVIGRPCESESERHHSTTRLIYRSPYDFEVTHHAGFVMLEDVAVIHPRSRPILGHPRDPHGAARRQVDDVFPGTESRCVSVDRK